MHHELPNDLRSSSSQNENFNSTGKSLLKNRNWTFPVVRYFTWKLEFVSDILWTIVGFWIQIGFVMLVLVSLYSLHILICLIEFPCISVLPVIDHLRLLLKCILSKTIILHECIRPGVLSVIHFPYFNLFDLITLFIFLVVSLWLSLILTSRVSYLLVLNGN